MGSKMGSGPELKDSSRRAEGPQLPLGPQPGGGFLLGAGTCTGPGEGALTCIRRRVTRSPGTPHKRAAGTPCRTGTRCRGTGRGRCTRTPPFGSRLWTVGTGRPSPRSPVCRGTCRNGIPHDLGDSGVTAESPPPGASPLPPAGLPLTRAQTRDLLLGVCLSLCPQHHH